MPDLVFTPARPAPAYVDPGDLCVMASLFNIERENEKRVNFERFREPIDRAGIPLFVVECAFGDTAMTLGESPRTLRVRAASALWQKERLLNAALPLVPARYTKIAWIDADILFENENWAVEASTRLNDIAVVQLAQSLIRLPRGVSEYSGDGFVWESFGSVYAREPNVMLRGNFALHGHTGFGWAARREVIEAAGLYDGCVAGGGSHDGACFLWRLGVTLHDPHDGRAHRLVPACGRMGLPRLSTYPGSRRIYQRSRAASMARRPLIPSPYGPVQATMGRPLRSRAASRSRPAGLLALAHDQPISRDRS